MASIYDIARECRVSSATVSRVLNGSERVSLRTRERVLQKMHELRYTPNLSKNTVTRSIALAFRADTLNVGPYESGLMRQLLIALDECDIPVRIISSARLASINPSSLSAVISTDCDDAEQEWQRKLAGSVPVIAINSSSRHEKYHRIVSDHAQASQLAVAYLHRLGHRRIAYLNDVPRIETQEARHRGFEQACAELGIEGTSYLIHKETMLFESIDNLLSRKIGALYMGNGMFIARVHAVFHHLGVRVPEDVSLVTIDDGDLSAQLPVLLTAVRQPLDLMARKAIEILPAVVDGSCKEHLFTFTNELIIRDSVRKACS